MTPFCFHHSSRGPSIVPVAPVCMRQSTIPALIPQHTATLFNLICSKRFHRHYGGQPALQRDYHCNIRCRQFRVTRIITQNYFFSPRLTLDLPGKIWLHFGVTHHPLLVRPPDILQGGDEHKVRARHFPHLACSTQTYKEPRESTGKTGKEAARFLTTKGDPKPTTAPEAACFFNTKGDP